MTTKKPKFSKPDSRGVLYVDCSECERGGNGADEDKCACGYDIKRGNRGACFSGTLMECYREPAGATP